ncbi:unnamed protein product [Caenorhabditis brenneri]
MAQDNLFWCNLDPNRVWRAPTPKDIPMEQKKEDPSLMMRLTHNTSCISLSAMEQQPSGSTATIFSPCHRPRRNAQLEDQLLMNLQNVTILSPQELELASLGITPMGMNPWQPMSFGTASTNGFSDSCSLSPISSPELRKNHIQGNGFHQQRSYNKNPAHPNHFRNNRTTTGVHQNGYHQQYQGNNRQFSNNTGGHQTTVVPSRTYRFGEEPHKPDLGYWLKKLRLHKYAPLFQDMTYRQLLALNNGALDKMRVTNGARKKIAQSIEKLHERPGMLRSLEHRLKNGSQCVRCAICSVRQLLWSPFIRYEGSGTRKQSQEIIDAFNVPSNMISDDNLPALMFRVIETLNSMVFPLRKNIHDMEDEYLLTMFHMFESVMKNDAFTPTQQRKASAMKKNARNYANPEEIRRHRMGMVSSAQCEGCHHAEVVNRERIMELQDRQFRQCHGGYERSPATYATCTALLDFVANDQNARLEFNVPPVAASQVQRIHHKRPADNEWVGTPKHTAAAASTVPSDADIFENLILPQMEGEILWENAENIWRNDEATTNFGFPKVPRGQNREQKEDPFGFLQMMAVEQPTKEASLSDFNFPESCSSSKKANSTGSGYSSSSDSESSSVTTSPPSSITMDTVSYGPNTVLCPPPPFPFL